MPKVWHKTWARWTCQKATRLSGVYSRWGPNGVWDHGSKWRAVASRSQMLLIGLIRASVFRRGRELVKLAGLYLGL